MQAYNNLNQINFDSIPEDPFWNTGEEREMKMHRIHSYPAKFPAFIATKALEFAKNNGIQIHRIADVFCGCGTVALEAKRNNINFWGCDINPVATMIAKTKSQTYNLQKLEKYYNEIISLYESLPIEQNIYQNAAERLKYWYTDQQYENLCRLKKSILESVPLRSSYLLFFNCAFSNILKASSRWLTKSIKPQVDPDKMPLDVLTAFKSQYDFMIAAYKESDLRDSPETKIVTKNFLSKTLKRPYVDMIITSPPYVTSYEYADLHQLSSLWLNYAEDYRDLRAGSVGSLYHVYNFNKKLRFLNNTGTQIVSQLLNTDKSKARSVAKYFLDMQQAAKNCSSMISDNGIALFVIGNTEYKGVRIDNAKHLTEALFDSDFTSILVTKRKITGKILTPYRAENGRFTTDSSGRQVYGEEFIIIGKKATN